MKILVLIESPAPSRYWEAAIPLLREKGIATSFATIREKGELSSVLESRNVPVYSFGARSSRDYPFVAWHLARLVRKEQFQIVHACESIAASISGVSAFFSRTGIRLFHRQHNICPQRTKFFHNLANWTSDFMMTCSESTKRYAAEVDGFDESKISVAYNGINPLRKVMPTETEKIRLEFGIPENAKIISLVARLREEKGHLTLFKAAEIVAKALPEPLHIVVTGSGYYEDVLRQAAQELKHVTVHFSGNQDDIAPWFTIGDIVSMPSYIEPFGIVATEAMSCGKPLIASGVDGLLEVVEDGVSGILVPPRNESALASAIERVFSSPDIANRLAQNGRRRVCEKFSMNTMVDGWVNCYLNVVRQSSSTPR